MEISFWFDEITSPRDLGIAWVGGAWGNVEHDNQNEKIKFIANNYAELRIALKISEKYIKKKCEY